ncbi:hypothetical protein Moror_13517 [Moniliophthora roreri MCA 2997]|uniref:Uncharacterized protein n=1 Tax=Moniliophthora roreri (strain MCA 2997) TaxID=1381753 RepID=V2XWP6_MONRO|nr:hypothetical protein Moror_13517 [Moniliophthora roreri MCA 2997]
MGPKTLQHLWIYFQRSFNIFALVALKSIKFHMALLSEFTAGLNDSSLLPSSSPEVVTVVLNTHSWKLRLIPLIFYHHIVPA